jgi:hypothetical protein
MLFLHLDALLTGSFAGDATFGGTRIAARDRVIPEIALVMVPMLISFVIPFVG